MISLPEVCIKPVHPGNPDVLRTHTTNWLRLVEEREAGVDLVHLKTGAAGGAWRVIDWIKSLPVLGIVGEARVSGRIEGKGRPLAGKPPGNLAGRDRRDRLGLVEYGA